MLRQMSSSPIVTMASSSRPSRRSGRNPGGKPSPCTKYWSCEVTGSASSGCTQASDTVSATPLLRT